MSTLEKGRPGLSRWYRVTSLKHNQLLMGYRFFAPEDGREEYTWYRSGTHLIMFSEPLAGPIYLRWSLGHWLARCIGCGESSKLYKIRHYGLVHWAQRHLCTGRIYPPK